MYACICIFRPRTIGLDKNCVNLSVKKVEVDAEYNLFWLITLNDYVTQIFPYIRNYQNSPDVYEMLRAFKWFRRGHRIKDSVNQASDRWTENIGML